MFTGLVEEMGQVESAKKAGPGLRLTIKSTLVAKDAAIGDSIAVNGCCLSVVKKEKGLLTFDAGDETLGRTNLGRLKKGDRVNLERSLVLSARLGGHFVTGHIDSTASVIKRRDDGEWATLTFRVNQRLTRQMASKGSIAVDGVSLTLVMVELDRFSVALIPLTLENTTLGKLDVGDVVNLETDLLAKYVQRQLESRKYETSTLL
ncbi:MAG: riboflavin synthase [Pirellulaceae bacterium]|nr:riboflavin synthase [Pirellulaceae bacterium]